MQRRHEELGQEVALYAAVLGQAHCPFRALIETYKPARKLFFNWLNASAMRHIAVSEVEQRLEGKGGADQGQGGGGGGGGDDQERMDGSGLSKGGGSNVSEAASKGGQSKKSAISGGGSLDTHNKSFFPTRDIDACCFEHLSVWNATE